MTRTADFHPIGGTQIEAHDRTVWFAGGQGMDQTMPHLTSGTGHENGGAAIGEILILGTDIGKVR